MGPAVRETAVVIEDLVKLYPGAPEVRAVDGVDLSVGRGETFGLLGPNGAGKSTTVGICTTRVLASAGRVVVAGVDVGADPARVRRRIGVVTQKNTLDRACDVWQNLYFHCRFFAMGKRASKRRADELLEEFRLADRAKAKPIELSGGMAQRLQVARAIAHEPEVLFLDEPTAGLDPQSRLALWKAVGQLQGRTGVTVMLTTHHMEEADSLCDRVAIIDHGRILVCDEPAALRRSIGAEAVIELALTGETDVLAGRLGELDAVVKVEPTGAGLRVMAASGDGIVPKIVEACLGHGLRDVSITEPTLETVFITLTGRELRE